MSGETTAGARRPPSKMRSMFPRHTPRQWRPRRVSRRWRHRLAPKPFKDKPKGPPRFSTRLRRLFWAWWVWVILAILLAVDAHWSSALTAALMACLSYLTTPSERPPQYGLDHDFSVSDPAFLPTMAGATGEAPSGGNRITILNNGDDFYPAMLHAIQQAQDSITMEAYIYWAGDIGKEVAAALAARSRAGVLVKILLDAVGSATIGEDILKTLEGGKVQLAWYNPVRWYSIGRLNHRTHRKSLIIDGQIAFTGGAGIADHWLGHAQDPAHWRDLQLCVEGPAARPLQTGFAHNWLQTTGELISGDAYYPPPQAAGTLSALTIISSPETGASTVRTMYYLSIVCARKSIYIANPYFVPDEVAIAALVDARKRGVDVRIMVAGRHNDAWVARFNSVRLYGPLLRAGVTILEYNRTMLHQKTMVVDGLWATVGTTNFDNRSFAHNEENNVCVHDAAWARQLEQVFQNDAKLCDPVDLDTWQRRGWLARTGEIFSSFLDDQV